MWYRYAQFVSDKGEDFWVKRILNIIRPNWQNSPDAYELLSDVLDNLDEYKRQYGPRILANLKQYQPKVPKGYAGPLPPIHDNCRCRIETMPGGRQIWQYDDDCCEECLILANEFNKVQFMKFGI